MNMSTNVSLPSRSSSFLPVNLGNQKWMPAKAANTDPPKST